MFPKFKISIMLVSCFTKYKKRIPFLKSKNITEKKLSKDLIANIKLMFFIPEDKIKGFYANIKQKFNSSSFLQFYKYLHKFYLGHIMENYIYGILINYYKKSSFTNFRLSILDTDIYFENKLISNINKKNKKIKLINLEKLKEIYSTYVEIL